jgi:hypothetical protein
VQTTPTSSACAVSSFPVHLLLGALNCAPSSELGALSDHRLVFGVGIKEGKQRLVEESVERQVALLRQRSQVIEEIHRQPEKKSRMVVIEYLRPSHGIPTLHSNHISSLVSRGSIVDIINK